MAVSTMNDTSVRDTSVHGLENGSVVRGRNFWVQWIEGIPAKTHARSDREMLLLLPDPVGARISVGERVVNAPGRSLCVLSAGDVDIELTASGRAALVASSRPDLPATSVRNQFEYAEPDPRIRSGDAGFVRRNAMESVHIALIDEIAPPPDNPRLKMFQTETLSINWVEYDGVRDRSLLSPHSHADFEQGSLAIAGDFVHHLRVNWGRDANQWREDRHLQAPSPSMITIPVHLVHTTEGVGGGRHLLIDVFSPPRADFIAKGWVWNSCDYAGPPPA